MPKWYCLEGFEKYEKKGQTFNRKLMRKEVILKGVKPPKCFV